jgi:hypothetical protein
MGEVSPKRDVRGLGMGLTGKGEPRPKIEHASQKRQCLSATRELCHSRGHVRHTRTRPEADWYHYGIK